MAAKVSTNGPNGTASVTKGPVIDEPPVKTPINESGSDGVSVTKIISQFVSDTTWEDLSETIVEKLKELLLDHMGSPPTLHIMQNLASHSSKPSSLLVARVGRIQSTPKAKHFHPSTRPYSMGHLAILTIMTIPSQRELCIPASASSQLP